MADNTTERLQLPKITGSMNADVVRDFNALAEAVDTKVASKDDLDAIEVTKESVGLGNVDNVKQASKAEFAAHQADYVMHPAITTTTNSGNDYSVILDPPPSSYVNGMGLILNVNTDSTGDATINVNGLGAIPIRKANGANVNNLKVNGVYTLRYSSSAFILQGEGASGNAVASDLLSGKTASTDAGDIVGTMPNRGNPVFIPSATPQTLQPGYYEGGTIREISLQPGEMLWFSHDAEINTFNTTPTKLKAIRIRRAGGRVRVKFDLRFAQVAAGMDARAQIYINNSPAGTLRVRSQSTYLTYSEDFTVNENDEISIYAYKTGSSYSAFVSNFRLYVDGNIPLPEITQ